MKISITPIKTLAIGTILGASAAMAQPLYSQNIKHDRFEYSVPASGSENVSLLKNAPQPRITISGKTHLATIVIDLSHNLLYKYDKFGKAQKAYLVASGTKSTPTHTGVRVVTHIETYPYRTAPKKTKRRNNPKAYGPNIICLNKLDTKTGEQSPTGEFIHGNNNPSSIGKYASQGCIRMDNEVIKQLSKEVQKGDIIIIQ